jgi:hypothetical protein
MGLVFIEGLPGSGKSTLAKCLCDSAIARGITAKWYLEEDCDHPIHPSSVKKLRRSRNFPQLCLRQVRDFIEAASQEKKLHILEGTAFQSTVRFMMEEELGNVSGYYREFEAALPFNRSALIYLRAPEAHSHSCWTAMHRGVAWSNSVGAYLEKTSYCRSRGLYGIEGMHQFWSEYARICDDLVASSRLHNLVVDVRPGQWERHLGEVEGFLDRLDILRAGESMRLNSKFDTDASQRRSI